VRTIGISSATSSTSSYLAAAAEIDLEAYHQFKENDKRIAELVVPYVIVLG
jgi:hypothetical protein